MVLAWIKRRAEMLLGNHELTKTAQVSVVWLKQLLHFFWSKIKPFFEGVVGGVVVGLFVLCVCFGCLLVSVETAREAIKIIN